MAVHKILALSPLNVWGDVVDAEGGSRKPEGEKLVSPQPSAKDFPMGREMDHQTLAELGTFSEPAMSAIHKLVLDYARTLIRAAVAVKEKVRGDNVSAANVQEASFSLNQQEQKGLVKLVGVLGGTLFGIGFSTLAAMIQTGDFTRDGTILAVLTGAVGAFLIALNLAEGFLLTWRKRRSAKLR